MWKTICSAPSAQDIEKMINEYYYSKSYVLGDEIDDNHFTVISTKTLRKDSNIVRYYRKRWQYGYYYDKKGERKRY